MLIYTHPAPYLPDSDSLGLPQQLRVVCDTCHHHPEWGKQRPHIYSAEHGLWTKLGISVLFFHVSGTECHGVTMKPDFLNFT